MHAYIRCTHTGCDAEYEYGYEIEPGEPEVRCYPDGSGYPGSPESIEITNAEFSGNVAPCGHVQDWDLVAERIRDFMSFEDWWAA